MDLPRRKGGGSAGQLIAKDVVLIFTFEGEAVVRALVDDGQIDAALLTRTIAHLEQIDRPCDGLKALLRSMPNQTR
jgi:hypothetical protein